MKRSIFGLFLSHAYHSLALPFLHDTFSDAGGGAGSGPGGASSSSGGREGAAGTGAQGGGQRGTGGQQGDRGTGDRGAGGQGGQGGGTGDQVYEMRDDAKYKLSDGRIVTGAEYKREMEAQIDGDYRGRYSRGYELLLAEAKRIDALARSRGGNNQPQNQPPDLLAGIRDKAVIGGQDIAQLYDMLQKQGLGPIAQIVANLAKQVEQQGKLLTTAQQRFGSADEEHEQQAFEGRLDKILSTVEVKGLEGRLDPKSPALRTAARNLFLSYVPSSWKAGEFERQLAAEFSDLVAAIREADKKAVFDGRQKLKEHFNPGRGTQRPSGGDKYKFETPREIAAKAAAAGMFGGGRT